MENQSLSQKEILVNLIGKLVPEGETKYQVGNLNYTITKTKDKISVIVEQEDTFDDSEIKDLVSDYKDALTKLNDEIFIEAMEDITKVIDVNEFDRLLGLKHYTKDEADVVRVMIDKSSEIIYNTLVKNISNLQSISSLF